MHSDGEPEAGRKQDAQEKNPYVHFAQDSGKIVPGQVAERPRSKEFMMFQTLLPHTNLSLTQKIPATRQAAWSV